MPKEVAQTSVGMSVQELVRVRPKVQFTSAKTPVDPAKMRTGTFLLLEELDRKADFHTTNYWIEDGMVIAISLLGTSPPGRDHEYRRRVIGDCVQRWGKKFIKRALEVTDNPTEVEPTLAWRIGEIEVILSLPPNRKEGDMRPSYVAMQFRPIAQAKKHPRKDKAMTALERRALFRAHDVDE